MAHFQHPLPSTSRNTSPTASIPGSPGSMTKSATTPSKGGKRKGTRSVSTLTPSQLARKRANDREAQRAIRARTKEHIENLEREIDELRSRQNRDQTVQDLLRRNKGLEDEVRRLRESLGIRNTAPGHPYESSYSSSSQPSPFAHSTTPDYPAVSDLPPYGSVPDTTDVWSSSVPCSVPSTVSSPASSGATEDFGGNYLPTSMPTTGMLERSSIPPAMNSPTVSCINGDMGYDNVKSAVSRIWVPSAGGNRTNHSSIQPSAMEHVPNVLPSIPRGNVNQRPGLSYFETPVLTLKPTCQNDALILGYIADCRRLMSMSGNPPHREVILGPQHPNVRPLLQEYPNLIHLLGLQPIPLQTPASHPVVNMILSLFNNVHLKLPLERIGCFMLFQGLIAWLVHPTRETYIGLRDFLPPQSIQQTTAHAQWMDFVIWPRLRTAIIQRQSTYDNDEFRRAYGASLRLENWSGTISEAFTVDFSTGSIYATDDFIGHVWDLQNWAIHENFVRRYPELRCFTGRIARSDGQDL
ncbi:hypothetical protein GGR57DRAFT_70955 [Xylariaceae sp. FL1272]|nr:hypothetical protein GGR57DRAFT_70955 [Xylariaceae sp. FL1272]